MACKTLTLAGGAVAIVCSRGPRPKPCAHCDGTAAYLCDWKLGAGKRCDQPLCACHAQPVAKNKHLCPTHQAAYRDWLAERKQRQALA